MAPITPTVEIDPCQHDVSILSPGVISHGRAEMGSGEPIKIGSFIREKGVVISGASGRIEFNRLYVDFLWTAENHRTQGLGKAILEALERAAQTHQCKDALIETLSDRTATYYKKQGYSTLGQINGYIPGLTKHTLIKTFS